MKQKTAFALFLVTLFLLPLACGPATKALKPDSKKALAEQYIKDVLELCVSANDVGDKAQSIIAQSSPKEPASTAAGEYQSAVIKLETQKIQYEAALKKLKNASDRNESPIYAEYISLIEDAINRKLEVNRTYIEAYKLDQTALQEVAAGTISQEASLAKQKQALELMSNAVIPPPSTSMGFPKAYDFANRNNLAGWEILKGLN